MPHQLSFLPSANSKKWHSRRWWDNLGYVRARSLSNPGYRDVRYLLNHLRHNREQAVRSGDAALVQAVDRAIAAGQAWAHKGGDEQWWRTVGFVDDILRHQERLRLEARALDDLGAKYAPRARCR